MFLMRLGFGWGLLCMGIAVEGAEVKRAPQEFRQEMAVRYGVGDGLPAEPVQLVDLAVEGRPMAFCTGRWFQLKDGKWSEVTELRPRSEDEFVLSDNGGGAIRVQVGWRGVRQVLRSRRGLWLATEEDPYVVEEGKARTMGWPSRYPVRQIAVGPDGKLFLASSAGLFSQVQNGWAPVAVPDGKGRAWAVQDVLAVAFDSKGQLWFGTRAGVGCQTREGWRFFEGKDGLPWNEFHAIAGGKGKDVWFATGAGVIRFDGTEWHYRQGRRWLPHDVVTQIAVSADGNAWCATGEGVGMIGFQPMTLAQKAEHYEGEIERFIKRTAFGFVAEADLKRPGDKTSAQTHDSDNDGLWTAMYGAGQCFAYGATKNPKAKARAKAAFEALRFLQKVTQGGDHAPPKGYIARTIRPVEWPDPNVGRLERDREEQKQDRLWKVYEPRWPRSADGKWYWKSDTSSDELDGHYFFYPLYFELCAEDEAERERVRDVVRQITDHLVEHDFLLMDHDGKPTRWGVYSPRMLNQDPAWWQERGLNSLSILSYMAVAQYVTGDGKYEAASRELIDRHGYAMNALYPKAQNGPGSGNQSDDEMAFMSYYSLLRYSRDAALKEVIRLSFFRYWVNEAPEMNPFFNFAYAASNLNSPISSVRGPVAAEPWEGWWEDSMATLRGFPLDRLNWAHRNSHRLDIELLRPEKAYDLSERQRQGRGWRVAGKVLPVENRHFEHWNTDPWRLDYGGEGSQLGAGTVFLLPYYMGMFHGFISGESSRR